MTGLYSPINKLMEQVTRPKGTGAEYMAELQKKPGYKPAEAEDRDLQALMALPQMQRAEFMEKLKGQANKFPLKQNNLTGEKTHHKTYTIPGGKNYREILLRTPMPEGEGFEGVPHHFGGMPNILASVRVKDRVVPGEMGYTLRNKKSGLRGQHYKTPEEAQAAVQGYPEHLRPMLDVVPNQGPSKKMLHIEEIQSDWHQQGREAGYQPKDLDKQLKEAKAEKRTMDRYLKEADEDSGDMAYGEYGRMVDDQQAATEKLNRLEKLKEEGVPHGPHAKDWHELALKSMIQHAAENGYDQIGITPGVEQAKRYGFNKHVDTLRYHPETQSLHGLKNKRFVFGEHTPPEDLPKYIGKELSKNLLAQAKDSVNGHVLSGEELNVGGEGMKGFYDKMVPAFLNKFGKKHGVQVQPGGIHTDEDEMVPDNAGLGMIRSENKRVAPVHTFDITPAMREDVLKNGIPRYAEGGTVDPMGNYSDATDSPITDDLIEKPVVASVPAYVQAYRPDPTGKYGGKDGLETLPTEFRTNTLMDYAKAAGLASSMGYQQPTADQLVNLALQEGKRSDFGHNRSLSYDQPDVAKLIAEGIAPDSAAFAILAHQKMQTANRLKIPFERAWNGTGRSEFGKTGKDYANIIAAGSYAANHPKNKQLADLIRQGYESGKTMNAFDPGKGSDDSYAKGGNVSRETIKPAGHAVVKEKVTISPNMDAMQYELMGVKHFTKKAK